MGATVAANPNVLDRPMVHNQQQRLHYDAWIQTIKIATLYRSIDIAYL
jgi:hypothetical protein